MMVVMKAGLVEIDGIKGCSMILKRDGVWMTMMKKTA